MSMAGCLPIIQSSHRTEADLQKAFFILFKQQNSASRYLSYTDVKDFNKILDNLRLLSKSRLLLSRFCQYKFKTKYIFQYNPEEPSQIMIDGKNMHWVNEQFWKKGIKIKDFMGTTNIEKLIWSKYTQFIPDGEMTELIREFALNFVWFETQRINGIFESVGKSKEIIERYVFPVSLELGVENWSRNLCGVIDRFDRLTNESFAVLEYKYGKPKYITMQYQKSAITTELSFYDILMQGKEVYALQDNGTLIPIEEKLGFKPRFNYGSMLFFQDIEETADLFKINKRMLTETNKKIQNYWKMLDTGNFVPFIKPEFCTGSCESYLNNCELNSVWTDMDKEMDKIDRIDESEENGSSPTLKIKHNKGSDIDDIIDEFVNDPEEESFM